MKGVDYFLLALLQEDTCFSLPFPAKSDGGGDNTNSYHLALTIYSVPSSDLYTSVVFPHLVPTLTL